MKTLLILRHAKSSWKHPELADHDRPLNKRGRNSAPRMGQLLHDEALVPDLILTSTAARAVATVKLVTEACDYTGEVKSLRRLYATEPGLIVRVLREVSEAHQRVLLVGHNPELEGLIESLTGEAITLPAGGLALLELPLKHWKDLRLQTEGHLAQLWRPKQLAGED